MCRNEILLCDGEGCDVAVHQACYAVARVPRGKWHCDACKDKLDLAKPNCVCCPVVGGVLRKVSSHLVFTVSPSPQWRIAQGMQPPQEALSSNVCQYLGLAISL